MCDNCNNTGLVDPRNLCPVCGGTPNKEDSMDENTQAPEAENVNPTPEPEAPAEAPETEAPAPEGDGEAPAPAEAPVDEPAEPAAE